MTHHTTTKTAEDAEATVDGMTAEQWAREYRLLAALRQQELAQIADWQARLKAERTHQFAVETPDGIKHIGSDLATAQLAATLYDDAHIVTRTTTPWKPITTTN